MSNPGVVTLFNSKSSKIKRFTVEDNLGESIHIHLDNIRVDFTINEFIEFSDAISDSLKKINILHDFNVSDFDINFLNEITTLIPHIKSIDIVRRKLSSFKCIVRDENNYVRLVNIKDSPAYLYLTGDKQTFEKYNQVNYLGDSNITRLDKISQSIKKHGYPRDNKHVIIFKDQPHLIRDGQHRASVLASIHGLNYEIEVMVFSFRKTVKVYPKLFNIKVFSTRKLNIIKREVVIFLEWRKFRKDFQQS